jgi:outer membrane murein-binding lipoprotein Lpp
MRNGVYSLIIIAMVIATIFVAGCFAPTQTSQQSASTSSSAATRSSVTSSSAAVAPSTTASATPSQPAGRASTSIQFDRDPGTVKKGEAVSLGIEVTAPTSPHPMVCADRAAVTVLVDGRTMGAVTTSGCFRTAYFDLSSADTSNLAIGVHAITLRYAGDSTYQPSQSTSQITVTS